MKIYIINVSKRSFTTMHAIVIRIKSHVLKKVNCQAFNRQIKFPIPMKLDDNESIMRSDKDKHTKIIHDDS